MAGMLGGVQRISGPPASSAGSGAASIPMAPPPQPQSPLPATGAPAQSTSGHPASYAPVRPVVTGPRQTMHPAASQPRYTNGVLA